MPNPSGRLFSCLLLVCACAPAIHAHPDDPKLLDRVPRWEGPSYRAAVDRASERGVFNASGIVLQANITLPEFGGDSSAADCWGYTSPAGREYALIGLETSTSFVDVTDPANPQIVVTHPGPVSLWRDVKVFEDHAYSVNETGAGIQVFDMSNIDDTLLPGTSRVQLVSTIGGQGTDETHNVAIDTDAGYLYRCGGGNLSVGLRIYALTPAGGGSKANPTFVGQWMDRYVHDAQIKTMQGGPWAGRQIAFCCSGANNGFNNTGVDILDVTNKSSIVNLGRIILPNGQYSHQCWLTPSEQHLIVNDELSEQNLGLPSTSIVLDVSDLTNPVLVDTFTNGNTAITHNNYTDGPFVYAANYTSGLRIYDASDIFNAFEIAFFDTRPETESALFQGLWSSYPYFPSGTVIGSDLERGLFVWQTQLPGLVINFVGGPPTVVDPAGGTADVSIVPRAGATIMPGTEQLFVDSGAGFQPFPLSPAGGDLFTATFPPVTCPDTVSYYVQAQDSNGFTVTNPANAPTNFHVAEAIVGVNTTFSDNMETDTGWTVGAPGDTATTGIWERVDPIGTGGPQPEDDNPAGTGTMCWITGQHTFGQGVGFNDVDGGATTLISPTLDATAVPGSEAELEFYIWFSNTAGGDPGVDTMPISISNDNGSTWTLLEDYNNSAGQWLFKSYRVSDFVTPTNQVKVRFVAQDDGPGSIVEAGVDDLSISFLLCPASGCDGDADGNSIVDVNDITFVIFRLGDTGTPGSLAGDADGNGIVDVGDISYVIFRLGNPCP